MSFGNSEHTYPGPRDPRSSEPRQHAGFVEPVSDGIDRIPRLSRGCRRTFLSLWRRAIVMPARLIAWPVLLGGPSHALVRRVDAIVDQHGDALVSMRAELLRDIRAARPHNGQWDDEIARFINSRIAEALDESERAAIERHFETIQDHIARRVGEIAGQQWVYQ
jgi:hypothetical protein